MSGRVEVLFLGAGDAFCSGGQHQAGYVLRGEGATLLLDCGATSLAALHRHEVDAAALDGIFLSHLHGDHFGGLPFLFLEWIYRTKRSRPVEVIGPPGTAERVTTLFRTLYRDVGHRPVPFDLRFREVHPGGTVEIAGIVLEAFRVPHQQEEISLGVAVQIGSRRIVYSGDTGWTDDLLCQSAGADLFICECSFFDTIVPNHLAYVTLEGVRSRFESRRIILTHLGQEVLDRRAEVTMELAFDGLRVSL
ncbi:MAG: MBL fold metallo-hydrolase [Candidatus Binatia bacterium]|nr:MAG: MBL fold metallo-hydrolase [Candidatus Binatia bacterium]